MENTRDYLIELFKELNKLYPPEVNEYGRTVRHNITFNPDTYELFLTLSVEINGKYKWIKYRIDYEDLDSPIYLLLKQIEKYIDLIIEDSSNHA